ncbi:MAG: alpha/beta hydrolase [Treponema sp.]|jgi:alpha/beta superfamily hydrolase|nr:alpha/beta hydrolase [Treponema sp.]
MQKSIECLSDGLTLRGTAHIPDMGKGKYPMVIIFHGFTADRNEGLFGHTVLSRSLAKEGIASVRFDFMGSGESDGEFQDMSLLTEVADGNAILDFVRKFDYVDTNRIGLHGMSQGGAVAGLLAAERNDDIAALSLWAPAIVLIDDCKKKNAAGIDITKIEEVGYADFHGIKLGSRYYIDAISIDYYGKLKAYKKNAVIVHGDSDDLVPISYSERAAEILGDKAKLMVVQGAGHDFGTLEYREACKNFTVEFFKKEFLEGK